MSMSERPAFKFKSATIEYRVYYDPVSLYCVSKSLGDNGTKGPYIQVDKERYDSIDVCTRFKVVDESVLPTSRSTARYKKLQLNSNGQFKSTKNNLIFAVPEEYSGIVDCWDFIDD